MTRNCTVYVNKIYVLFIYICIYVYICVVYPKVWMPSLKMSLGLRIRSKVNWVQNNNIIDKRLLSMASPAYITFIKFADTIQDILAA